MTTEFTKGVLALSLATQYRRTDETLNPNGLKDNINFRRSYEFVDGTGGRLKAELQHYDTRTLLDTVTETIILDGPNAVTNKWNDSLQYEASKILIIENTETADDKYLKVTFKDEVYFIGPEGIRIICEPHTSGIEEETPSGSEPDEPVITMEAFGNITYNIFVIGTSTETSGA